MSPSEAEGSPENQSGTRRSFIQRGAAALTFVAIPEFLRAAEAPDGVLAATDLAEGDPSIAEFHEISLSELAEGIASRRWTSRFVVDWYLDAIARVDRAGPTINSILEINPEARAIADALDRELAEGTRRGPLHGVPILVKDNIGTADKMHTSAGSLALAEHFAPRDAFVVQRLRAAGCVILGKSNMSEWSAARGKASVGGWSGRGRLTRNPYALDRSAGGSSSGTAAAVSANLAAAALGTETMGSIVSPAALCGIVGLKPTVGLVSRAGLIPTSITQDTAGPMTRTVRDAAILLSTIAGPDAADPATADAARHAQADYTRFLDPNGLRGVRIGIARNLFGASLPADRVVQRGIEAMRGAGAVLVENANIETVEGIWSFDAEVLSFELKAALNAYFASLGPTAPVKNLAELIAFNARHADRELAWFGQETFEYAQEKGPLTSPEYQSALQFVRQLSRVQGIDATLRKHRVEALIAPTISPAWLTDVLLGDNAVLGSFVAPAAAGYPSLTVPAGDVSGLPVGMLFMGAAWSEPTLFKIGYGFEQTVRARRAPTFQPTIVVRP